MSSRKPKEEVEQAKTNENDKQLSSLKMDNIDILNTKPNLPSLSYPYAGVYIPPYKMAEIISEIKKQNNPLSEEYQRLMWDSLKKSFNGLINKVNISNIQNIIYELFNENLIRGKGLLVQSIMKSQSSSPSFTHIYAALISVLNTKLPDIGNLAIRRYIISFKKAYKRNNKITCVSSTKMIAHLINQQVNDSFLAFEILSLLLENLSADSIELSCNFLLECGQFISEANSQMTNYIFETFRTILQEGKIDKRIQYIVENLFLARKTNFKDHPQLIQELDLVNDEDRIIHTISLDDDINGEDELNLFQYDIDYEQNENLWNVFKSEILGEEGNEFAQNDNDNNDNNNNNNKAITDLISVDVDNSKKEIEEEDIDNNNKIINLNEEDLITLRRVIYLTIISSVDFQECCHKLLKLNMKEGQEMELVNMIIECCIQERAYLRFYGLLAERLCLLKEIFKRNFEIQFENQFIKVHRFETNKLRNLAQLFSHLLYTNAIDWSVLKIIKLTEEDTTASSRIFCKNIFQELAEYMGLEKLNDKLQEHAYDDYSGLFCRDNPKNTRFCNNFFTSIGLGALTQDLRDFLLNAEKMVAEQEEKEIILLNEKRKKKKKKRKVNESCGESDSESKTKSDGESSFSESSERRRDKERKKNKRDKRKKEKEREKGERYYKRKKSSSESSSFFSQEEEDSKEYLKKKRNKK